MTRRFMLPLVAVAVVAATTAFSPNVAKWPPWISIESPVNPFDATARGAAMLVHATFREGPSQLSDLSGTAEGLVNGVRRSIRLRFDVTGQPNVFALRRQWPTDGSWLLRINLRTTSALVMLDSDGNVASVSVPTRVAADGTTLPRGVTSKEIDSTLASPAKR
jgi:hypothetical protein